MAVRSAVAFCDAVDETLITIDSEKRGDGGAIHQTGGKARRFTVGSLSHCAEAVPLYTALSNSAPLTSIVEVVLTFSFNMLNKKLERMTSKPNDTGKRGADHDRSNPFDVKRTEIPYSPKC